MLIFHFLKKPKVRTQTLNSIIDKFTVPPIKVYSKWLILLKANLLYCVKIKKRKQSTYIKALKFIENSN